MNSNSKPNCQPFPEYPCPAHHPIIFPISFPLRISEIASTVASSVVCSHVSRPLGSWLRHFEQWTSWLKCWWSTCLSWDLFHSLSAKDFFLRNTQTEWPSFLFMKWLRYWSAKSCQSSWHEDISRVLSLFPCSWPVRTWLPWRLVWNDAG